MFRDRPGVERWFESSGWLFRAVCGCGRAVRFAGRLCEFKSGFAVVNLSRCSFGSAVQKGGSAVFRASSSLAVADPDDPDQSKRSWRPSWAFQILAASKGCQPPWDFIQARDSCRAVNPTRIHFHGTLQLAQGPYLIGPVRKKESPTDFTWNWHDWQSSFSLQPI